MPPRYSLTRNPPTFRERLNINSEFFFISSDTSSFSSGFAGSKEKLADPSRDVLAVCLWLLSFTAISLKQSISTLSFSLGIFIVWLKLDCSFGHLFKSYLKINICVFFNG